MYTNALDPQPHSGQLVPQPVTLGLAAAGLTLESPLVDGENYTSTLNPPPGHDPRHPAKTSDGTAA
ncbi:hypothetical protein AB0958_31590 [Streptomyces sp. NPDC006655]|uniref:hypothetical protein n=1 Tax=Streptomyces sp. NPDC006655 TaxID=3156898 RepID=UPI003455F401